MMLHGIHLESKGSNKNGLKDEDSTWHAAVN